MDPNRSNFLDSLPRCVPECVSVDPQRRTFVAMTKLASNNFDVRPDFSLSLRKWRLFRLQCYVGDVDRTTFAGLNGSPNLQVAPEP